MCIWNINGLYAVLCFSRTPGLVKWNVGSVSADCHFSSCGCFMSMRSHTSVVPPEGALCANCENNDWWRWMSGQVFKMHNTNLWNSLWGDKSGRKPMHTHTKPKEDFNWLSMITTVQADRPRYMSSSGDSQAQKRMVMHDNECPYCYQVSLNANQWNTVNPFYLAFSCPKCISVLLL